MEKITNATVGKNGKFCLLSNVPDTNKKDM
jgi:hypothetical protein